MSIKIRNYLCILMICLCLVVYFPFAFCLSFILGERQSYYILTTWGRLCIYILKYVAGLDYQVKGIENLNRSHCVVLSKHQSSLDIFVLLMIFTPQTWVLKKELLSIPFFGWSLRRLKPIAIDRSQRRDAFASMLKQGKERLEKGYWVLIYPEGTRTKPGETVPYKGGGVKLAQDAQCDIIPVALNTGLFWRKGKGLIKRGTVDVVIGKAITTQDKDAQLLLKEVQSWIEKESSALLDNPSFLDN